MKWQVHRLVAIIASITATGQCDPYYYITNFIIVEPKLMDSVAVDSTSFVAEIERSVRSTAVDVST